MRLTPEDYCDRCWTYVDEYISSVENNEIPTGEYIKKLIKKFKGDVNKWDFKVEKVDKVFKFFGFLNVDYKDQYVQFPLLPWQCFFLAMLFGFYHKDTDKRKYREGLLMLGRKNGKSSLAAAIQLFLLLGDGVGAPQSILLSNTARQASNALNYAKDILNHSPALNKRLKGQRNRIVFRDNTKQGFCEVMSTAEPARLEGSSPSGVIFDEIHEFQEADIYNSMKTGTGARMNPVLLSITTAGSRSNGFCREYLDYHKNVLDGKIVDETVLGMIFQPDPKDPQDDPETWKKSNPSLGAIIQMEDLQASFNKAQYSFQDKFFFITKHLNIFWDAPTIWIPLATLDPLFGKWDLEKFRGRTAFMGMDLSRNNDLASIVLIFPPDENFDKFFVYPLFFLPGREENMVRTNGLDLTDWIHNKYIIKCESKVLDLDLIFNKIKELSEMFNIVHISYDSFNAVQLTARLVEEGFNCEAFDQKAIKFNAPLKMLESFVYEGKINFWGNPCLLWNFENVVLWIDPNANIKIVKNKQNDSVDGVVALAMALGGWIDNAYGKQYAAERASLSSYIKK